MSKFPSITLTDPSGKPRAVVPQKVLTVFFNSVISPPKANSNIGYDRSVRSFLETPEEVADMLGEHIPLLKLTLPDIGDSLDLRIWVSLDRIVAVYPADDGGSLLEVAGQKGKVKVTESPDYVDNAIAGANT